MLRHDLADLPLWMILAALAAGLSAAGLVFLVGRHLIRRYWPSGLLLEGPDALAVPKPDTWYPPATEARPEDIRGLCGGPERRRWLRRSCNPVRVLVLEGSKTEPSHGVVINHSEGGVALLVDARHEPGTVLSVRRVEAPEDLPWVHVEVRHRQRSGRQWLVGCQFVEPPPWNVLVWLG